MTLTQKSSTANTAIISDPNSSEKERRKDSEILVILNLSTKELQYFKLITTSDISETLAVTNDNFKATHQDF